MISVIKRKITLKHRMIYGSRTLIVVVYANVTLIYMYKLGYMCSSLMYVTLRQQTSDVTEDFTMQS